MICIHEDNSCLPVFHILGNLEPPKLVSSLKGLVTDFTLILHYLSRQSTRAAHSLALLQS